MAVKVIVEQFYENMEEATIGSWLKGEGEYVRTGEPLVEIITEKVTFEMESPAEGLLRQRVGVEKSVVPVGYVLALLGEAEEPLPDVAEENRQLLERRKEIPVPLTAAAPKLQQEATGGELRGADRTRATPAARRLAKEHGVDLAEVARVTGSKVVTEEDVARFAEGGQQ